MRKRSGSIASLKKGMNEERSGKRERVTGEMPVESERLAEDKLYIHTYIHTDRPFLNQFIQVFHYIYMYNVRGSALTFSFFLSVEQKPP